MNQKDIIDALDRWFDFEPDDTPESIISYMLLDVNENNAMGYSAEEADRDAPLILAWLRGPTIIDPDHDDSETWIRRHHG